MTWPASAPALPYTVHACSDLGVVSNSDTNLQLTIACNNPMDILARVAPPPQNSLDRPVTGSRGWVLTAPTGTKITHLAYDRHLFGGWLNDDVRWELRTTATLGDASGTVYDDFLSDPTGSPPLPDDAHVDITLSVSGLWSLMGCMHAISNPCSQNATTVFGVELTNLVVTLDDTSLPTAPQLGGSLTSGAPQSGAQTWTASSSDQGSGVLAEFFELDGQLFAAKVDPESTCDTTGNFTTVTPCASSLSASFPVDTTTLTEGSHRARVISLDGSGNTTSSAFFDFTVRNTPTSTAPPVLAGPATVGGQLTSTTGTWDADPNAFNFTWLRCPATVTSAAGAAGCTPILDALDAHFYTATSADAGQRIMVKVVAQNTLAPKAVPTTAFSAPSAVVSSQPVKPPPGGPPGGPPPPGSDRTPPALSAVSLSHARFRAAKGKGTASLLRLTSSEAGKLTVVIERALPGKQVKRGGKLVCTAVRTPVKRARCTRYRRATTITRTIAAGRAGIALTGRIGTRRMAPGAYRITLVARDAAGNVSRAKRLTFTLLAG